MDISEILSKVDHTLLSQTSTWEEIKSICDDGMKYKTASVCIPPCYVKSAKKYVKDSLKICTVIGFPNGYSTLETKLFETQNALNSGADEIDMVINLGYVKQKKFDVIEDEIRKIKSVCKDKILKVIIETCLLADEEKIKMCEVISKSGADYIKTSTGFSKSGATIHDVELFKNNISDSVKIKAAGGISSLEDAENFLKAGASRLGTSRIVKLVKNI